MLLPTYLSAFSMASLSVWAASSAANELEDMASEAVKSSFSTAALLSDSSVVKLGLFDFNPNNLVDLNNNELGTDDATALRNSIKQFNFPWSREFSGDNRRITWHAGIRASYIDFEQELFLGSSEVTRGDELSEQILSLSAGGGTRYQIDNHWSFEADMSLSWMRYRSTLDYNTGVAAPVQDALDGLIVNYDISMLMLEPVMRLNYQWQKEKTEYTLYSDFHYLHGEALSTQNCAHEVTINEWYASAGLKMITPFSLFGASNDYMKYRATRIELSDTIAAQMGSGHYYEFEMGWLRRNSDDNAFVHEYGLGLNLNYGSVLKGGTLVLYYTFL